MLRDPAAVSGGGRGCAAQEDSWAVITSYFEEKGLVRQQLESFDEFINSQMQEIVDENDEHVVTPQQQVGGCSGTAPLAASSVVLLRTEVPGLPLAQVCRLLALIGALRACGGRAGSHMPCHAGKFLRSPPMGSSVSTGGGVDRGSIGERVRRGGGARARCDHGSLGLCASADLFTSRGLPCWSAATLQWVGVQYDPGAVTDVEGKEYIIHFGQIYLSKPTMTEADGETGLLFPKEARLRNLTCAASPPPPPPLHREQCR